MTKTFFFCSAIPAFASLLVATCALEGQTQPIAVDNSTTSLIITGASLHTDPSGNTLEIVLQNASTKSITGFELSLGPTDFIQEFLAPISKGFNPGETFEKSLPIPASLSVSAGLDATTGRSYFRLQGVIFSDGSAEGEPAGISDLRAIKRGNSVQLARILPLLESALALDPAKQRGGLRSLADRIQALPDVTENGQEPSALVKSVMTATRESTARELLELESDPRADVGKRLLIIKNTRERMLTSLKQQVSGAR